VTIGKGGTSVARTRTGGMRRGKARVAMACAQHMPSQNRTVRDFGLLWKFTNRIFLNRGIARSSAIITAVMQYHGDGSKSRHTAKIAVFTAIVNPWFSCNWHKCNLQLICNTVNYLLYLLYTVKRVHTTRCRLFPKLGTFWHLIGWYTFYDRHMAV